MDRLLSALKAQAVALDRAQGQPRFGLIASIDPSRYAARVILQPEGVLTGWLPVLTPWVGAGWGLVCLPSPGDQVLVLAQEGESEHGIVVGSSYSDCARPPTSKVGEIQLLHRSGISLRLGNDGVVHIEGPTTVDGNVTINGSLTVTGTITGQGSLSIGGDVSDFHGALNMLRSHYNAHSHPGAAGPPSPQD
jgi:phage baseplate assembly protein gpV